MDRFLGEAYAVILAGGSGTRFWPKSRRKSPKQLCAIGSSAATMIEKTLERLDGFIPPERRIIVTHMEQAELTSQIVGESCGLVLAEPEARNTAAALALAALAIKAISPVGDRALMVSLHADHVIADISAFRDSLVCAARVAQDGYLTLLGLTPRYPETGFGYIERGQGLGSERAYRVKNFCEKPPLATAREYMASGEFYWNSGLFVWQVSTLLDEFQRLLPAVSGPLSEALSACSASPAELTAAYLAPYYRRVPKVSIDDGILAASKNVAVVEASFDWQDVGSWHALSECFPTDEHGNLAYGDALLLDTKHSTIDSDGPLVVTLGVEDLVVVVAKGAVLVCPKKRSQDVKLIVERLRELGRGELL